MKPTQLLVPLSQFTLFLAIVTFCDAELYTALAHMRGLVRLEKVLHVKLTDYLQVHPGSDKELHRVAEEVTLETADIKGDLEQFLGHPVNTYFLIRRFTKHWKTVEENLAKNDKDEDLLALIKKNIPSFPSSDDLFGCIKAIQRIQDVYNISARQIADGKLSYKTLTPDMNADQCFEIGYAQHKWERHEESFQWMTETIRRLEPPYEYHGELERAEILEFLAWAEYMTNRLEGALQHTAELLALDPESDFGVRNLEFFGQEIEGARKSDGTRQEEYFKKPKPEKEEFMKSYEKLCRGISNKPQSEKNRLKCYYDFKRHPMLRIRPLKVEELHHNPDIWMLRDVIYDSEIDYIKETAAPKLKRATVTNKDTGELEFADYRISKSGWLEDDIDDNDDNILKRVNRRTSIITGLDARRTSAEALQIVNYGSAGHYEPHFDHATESYSSILRMGMGNRIATVLFYLSDVEAGGSTVFVDAEAIVRPAKGDASFWYNLRKNGEGDDLTRHAGCPVIVGSKWICNKWIHVEGQEFTRPCGLSIED